MGRFWKRNGLLCLIAVLLLSFFGLALSRMEEALPTGSWGLHFPEEGACPIGNADREKLAAYDGVYVGKGEEKVLYLTFDAGYENGYTARILDVLKAHGVKAAFFLVGNYMEQNPELVKRMVEEGHLVGNHTYHHYDMSKIDSMEAFRKELEDLEYLYKEITGETMEKYYRPPQGLYSEDNLRMAKELGYRTVFWSLAYVDWKNDGQPTAEEAFEKLLPRTHNGAVILLHSTSKTNSEILDDLISRWKEQGYRFAGLEELF